MHAFSPNGNICPLVPVASVLKNEVIWAPDRSSIRGLNSSRGGSGDGMGGSAEEGEGEKLRAGPLASSVGIHQSSHVLVSCGRHLDPSDESTLVFSLQMVSPFPARVRPTLLTMTRAGSCNGKILVPSPQGWGKRVIEFLSLEFLLLSSCIVKMSRQRPRGDK